jgi:nucleotide-binding universal stress UspA family protein
VDHPIQRTNALVVIESEVAPEPTFAMLDALQGGRSDERTRVAAVSRALTREAMEFLLPYACTGDEAALVEQQLVRAFASRLATRTGNRPKPQGVYGASADSIDGAVRASGAEWWLLGRPESGDGAISRLWGAAIGSTQWPVAVPGRTVPEQVQRIGVALDLGAGAGAVFRAALDLAHALQARVHPCFVIPTVAHLDPGRCVQPEPDERMARARKEAIRLFQQLEAGLELPYGLAQGVRALSEKVRVEAGEPSEALTRWAVSEQLDLLVMGGRRAEATGPRRLGRTTAAVIDAGDVAVWVHPG